MSKPMVNYILLAAILCGAAGVAPHHAHAQSARRQAAELLRQGAALYKQGDKSGTLEKFSKAYNLFPSYKIEYNIAVLLEEMGRWTASAEYFERFVTTKHKSAPGEMVQLAHQKLRKLRRKLASVTVTCNVEGAWLLVAGKEVGQLPMGFRTYYTPDKYHFAVKKRGYQRFQKSVVLRAGSHLQLEVELTHIVHPVSRPEPVPAAQTRKFPTMGKHPAVAADVPQPAPTSRPLYKKWWFWTAVGAVVVGAVIGGTVAATSGGDELPDGDIRWKLAP